MRWRKGWREGRWEQAAGKGGRVDRGAVILKGTQGGEEDFRAGRARRCTAGEDVGGCALGVVDQVVGGRVGGRVEVSYEGRASEEGGLVAINRVGTAPDRAKEIRVHDDGTVSRVGERVV